MWEGELLFGFLRRFFLNSLRVVDHAINSGARNDVNFIKIAFPCGFDCIIFGFSAVNAFPAAVFS